MAKNANNGLALSVSQQKCPGEEEIYYKGDDSNNILSHDLLRRLIETRQYAKFRFNKLKHNGKEERCKQDLPVDK